MKKFRFTLLSLILVSVIFLSGCDIFKIDIENNDNNSTNYSVSITSTQGGTATGAGLFLKGSQVTVQASANENYTFANWTENNTVVSTQATYTFTLNSNRTLRANFTEQTSPINTFAGEYYLSALYQDGVQIDIPDLLVVYSFAENGDYNVKKLNTNDEPGEPPYKWTSVFAEGYKYELSSNKINTLNPNGSVLLVNDYRFESNTLIITGNGSMLDEGVEYYLVKNNAPNLTGNYQLTYITNAQGQPYTDFAYDSVTYQFNENYDYNILFTADDVEESLKEMFSAETIIYEVVSNYIIVSVYDEEQDMYGVVMVNEFIKNNNNLQIIGDGSMLDEGVTYYCTKTN